MCDSNTAARSAASIPTSEKQHVPSIKPKPAREEEHVVWFNEQHASHAAVARAALGLDAGIEHAVLSLACELSCIAESLAPNDEGLMNPEIARYALKQLASRTHALYAALATGVGHG